MDIIKKTKNRQKMSVFRLFNISFLLQTDKIQWKFWEYGGIYCNI